MILLSLDELINIASAHGSARSRKGVLLYMVDIVNDYLGRSLSGLVT